MRMFCIYFALIAMSAPIFARESGNISGEEIIQIFKEREKTISEDKRGQIQSAIAAFGSLKAEEITYVSCPVSSGKRLYQYMDLHGYRTVEEARADSRAFFESVILPNIEKAEALSASLAGKTQGVVIAPSSFEDKKVNTWRQNEFMSMWLSVIENSVTRIVMIDGWEYSNGAAEEFLWAILMQQGCTSRANIEIFDEKGEPLTLERGKLLLRNALADMRQRGLTAKTLEDVIFFLEQFS